MSLTPGTALGRYRILKRLGSGAMGEVYLAEDPQIERQVALKTVRILTDSGVDSAELDARLLREAKAAGRLVHQHAVTLFDAGEAEGVYYLAFEYVDGPDLSRRMREPPPLQLGEILRIGREAAEGLDAAHRQGIVHRDIKPANILLDPSGSVKISDFGIAKMVGQRTELTQTGSVVGSPHYLSPEQVRGEHLDGRSDLFSLGVVLYEMLSRKRPFDGESITTLVYQILSRDPVPIDQVAPRLPPPVRAIVTRLLAKDREERFESARDLVDALGACERELPSDVLAAPVAVSDDVDETRLMTGTVAPPPSDGEQTAPTVIQAPAGPPPPPPPPASTPVPSEPEVAASGSVSPSSTTTAGASSRRGGLLIAILLVVLLLAGGTVAVALWWIFHDRGITPPELGTQAAEMEFEPEAPAGGEESAGAAAGPVEKSQDSGEQRLEAGPTAAAETEGSGESVGEESAEPEWVEERPVEPSESEESRAAEEPQAPPGRRGGASPLPGRRERMEQRLEERVDQEIWTTTRLRFDVQPPDVGIAIRGRGDAAFRPLGRAEDWTGRVYQLPEPGDYLLLFRASSGEREAVLVRAGPGSDASEVSVRLGAPTIRHIDRPDLERFATGGAVVLDFTPRRLAARARVLVDGNPVGEVDDFAGGRSPLRLSVGDHLVEVVGPAIGRIEFVVEVRPEHGDSIRRIEMDVSSRP